MGVLTALLTSFTGCSLSSDVKPLANPALLDQREAVVVLHGYYGSALREKNGGTRRWLKLGTILGGNFRVALASMDLQVLESPELEVEGMLGKFTVLPWIYSTDVYEEFTAKMERSGRVQAIPFAYDWRQDLHGAVLELDALVKQLRERGVPKITLAAHSMGGLVALYYLAYGTQDPESAELNWAGAALVNQAGFFGTPFGGVMSILRNMQHGTGYPWNKRMLLPGTVASFPASYQLLPMSEARFFRPDGSELTLDLANPNLWAKHQLGLYREAPAGSLPAREQYTRRQVTRAAAFHRRLAKVKAPPASLKFFNAVGIGRPTLASGYLDEKRGEILLRPEEVEARGLSFGPLESDGDGTVPLNQAQVPPGISGATITVQSEFTHDRLFADPGMESAFERFMGLEIAPKL
jgi:pimeloyl-ACP methyl ester carboxylesterase